MPNASHGLPQWKRPPKYSYVIQCMWPSIAPPTRPNSVAPLVGVPVAFSGASGNSAQPVAGVMRACRSGVSSQSAGVAETPVGVTYVPSGPVEQVAAERGGLHAHLLGAGEPADGVAAAGVRHSGPARPPARP